MHDSKSISRITQFVVHVSIVIEGEVNHEAKLVKLVGEMALPDGIARLNSENMVTGGDSHLHVWVIMEGIQGLEAFFGDFWDELKKLFLSFSQGDSWDDLYASFGFNTEYEPSISWSLSNNQLKHMLEVMPEYPGISFEARLLNSDCLEEDTRKHYYQLIFIFQNEVDLLPQLPNQIAEYVGKDQESALQWVKWSSASVNEKGNQEISLNIKWLDIKYLEGIEVHDFSESARELISWEQLIRLLDCLFAAISSMKPLLAEHGIKVQGGYYQHTTIELAGGEIGKELLLPLADLDMGLRVTQSVSSPFE